MMATASNRRPGRPANEEIRARRQEEILEAAAKLFAERGYSDANTQELADLLQVGKGTIYRYFPTKQELFLAAVDRLVRQLKETIDAAMEGIEDPFERMAVGVRTYLRYFAEHPEVVELLIQERAQFRDRMKPTYFVHREANVGRWREEIRGLIAEGRVRDVPPERVTDVLGDLLYGTMFTNYFAGRKRSPEDQAVDILDIAFHGIIPEAERRRRQAE
jgi:AcrR family transcriptional regulator